MSYPPNQVSTLFNASYFDSGTYVTPITGDQKYLKFGGVGTLSALTIAGTLNTSALVISGNINALSYSLNGTQYLDSSCNLTISAIAFRAIT